MNREAAAFFHAITYIKGHLPPHFKNFLKLLLPIGIAL
jgi:hypothetical protein